MDGSPSRSSLAAGSGVRASSFRWCRRRPVRPSAAGARSPSARRLQERRRLASHGRGSDALDLAGRLPGQRRGEFGRGSSAANGRGAPAGKTQAEKIMKELHQPISS
jgi:hypothetical protein